MTGSSYSTITTLRSVFLVLSLCTYYNRPAGAMKKGRRRGITSDSILSLQESRQSRILRQNLPLPLAHGSSVHSPERSIPKSQHEPCSMDGDTPQQLRRGSTPDPSSQHTLGEPLLRNPEIGNDMDGTRANPMHTTNQDHLMAGQAIKDSDGSYCDSGAEDNYSTTNTPTRSTLSSSGLQNETTAQVPDVLEPSAADIALLEIRRRRWERKHILTGRTVSAIVAVIGSVRFSVKQYEYTRSILKDLAPDGRDIWPPYSTIQRCFKTVLSSGMPESGIVDLPKTNYARNNEDDVDRSENEPRTVPVRIFSPSAWAKLDVSTSRMFLDKSVAVPSSGACLENSKVVKCRSAVTDARRNFFVNQNGENIPCCPGATITLSVQNNPPNCEIPFNIVQADSHYIFNATVANSWVVGSTSSQSPSWKQSITSDGISDREKQLMTFLSTAES